ncbi:Sialate O-acetylesterase domain [Dillenia turbinata]|uniref:Sialate O-acetylesterase domain n=1 Tax=Dillenia turbinata TaxID=194707 RepID=A0AAN8VZI5_9MAGN
MKILCLLTLILLVAPRFVSPANDNSKKSLFILAGQSNMSGRGGVDRDKWDGIVPPECRSNPSILRLSPGLTWEQAKEPLHEGIDFAKGLGVGPGMSFANYVLAKNRSLGPIGLIPCAVGATYINDWFPGTFLFDRMMNRTKTAWQDGSTLWAILWYQGESDAINKEDANKYKQRLEQFIHDVRSYLNMPSLPFIQVGLATGMGPYKNTVRKAQFAVKLPNVKIVDAKGLPIGRDYVHITTEAEVHLGKKLAKAFLGNF